MSKARTRRSNIAGRPAFQFKALDNKPIFGELDRRRALMQRFNSIQGINFTDDDLQKYRSIPLSIITSDPEEPSKIDAALTWMEQQIKNSGTAVLWICHDVLRWR